MAEFDIVIPYYQRESGPLSRAVASIFDQGVPDVRIIIVDDGSPHDPENDLKSLPPGQRDRVHLVRQKNKGASGARNTGLDHVSADAAFVAFLDSDDTWTPGHLDRARRALSRPDVAFFWEGVQDHTGAFAEGHAPPSRVIPANQRRAIPDAPDCWEIESLAKVLCGQWFRHMHLSATVMRGDLARHTRFDGGRRIADDFEFFRRCATRDFKCVASDRPGADRGEGENLWHGAAIDGWRYSEEKYLMMLGLKSLRKSPQLDAVDREVLNLRIQSCRERFYWAQRERMKTRQAPHASLWARWLVRDPAIAGFVAGRASGLDRSEGRTVVPGDEV